MLKDGEFVCFDEVSCMLSFLLPHYNKKVRPFYLCIACNILVMKMRLKSNLMVEHIHWLN
jgi:hypothetical protein